MLYTNAWTFISHYHPIQCGIRLICSGLWNLGLKLGPWAILLDRAASGSLDTQLRNNTFFKLYFFAIFQEGTPSSDFNTVISNDNELQCCDTVDRFWFYWFFTILLRQSGKKVDISHCTYFLLYTCNSAINRCWGLNFSELKALNEFFSYIYSQQSKNKWFGDNDTFC